MSKIFKAGDKIKRVDFAHEGCGMFVGHVYTVDTYNGGELTVKELPHKYWDSDYFELIEEPIPFGKQLFGHKIKVKDEDQSRLIQEAVFEGVGSWAYLEDSSRDSYSFAIKGSHSVVDGEELSMQKTPKTAASSKTSARGLLRVEKEGNNFVLYDQQTWEQEAQGELKVVFKDGQLYNETSLSEIRNRLWNK